MGTDVARGLKAYFRSNLGGALYPQNGAASEARFARKDRTPCPFRTHREHGNDSQQMGHRRSWAFYRGDHRGSPGDIMAGESMGFSVLSQSISQAGLLEHRAPRSQQKKSHSKSERCFFSTFAQDYFSNCHIYIMCIYYKFKLCNIIYHRSWEQSERKDNAFFSRRGPPSGQLETIIFSSFLAHCGLPVADGHFPTLRCASA